MNVISIPKQVVPQAEALATRVRVRIINDSLPDVSWLSEKLLVGAGPVTPEGVASLVDAGVTTVVDARSHLFAPLAYHLKVLYLHDPTEDDGESKSLEWFKKALDFALPQLIRPGRRVAFFCLAGVNRSPSLVYAVLRATGFSAYEALALLHARRPVCVNGVRYRDDAERALKVLGYVT